MEEELRKCSKAKRKAETDEANEKIDDLEVLFMETNRLYPKEVKHEVIRLEIKEKPAIT